MTAEDFYKRTWGAKDCIWYNNGYCAKALPGVECDITKCVCYTLKSKSKKK